MFTLSACVVIFIVAHVLYWIKYHKRNAALATFPTPKKHFLLHNSMEMVGLSLVERFKKFQQWHDDLGEVFLCTIHPFDCGTVFINEPKIAETISFHQPDRSRSLTYKALSRWIGVNGYFLSSGETLKSRTKPIRLLFHPRCHAKYVTIINHHKNEAIQAYKESGAKFQVADSGKYARTLALDVAFDIILGYQLNSKKGENNEYVRSIERFFRLAMLATFDPRSRSEFLYPFTKLCREEQKALNVINGFILNIIKDRKKMFAEGKIEGQQCILDYYLLNSIDGEMLPDQDVVTEMNTFILGMHDTTQSSSGFLMYVLAKYPDVQEKVYEEVCQLLRDDPDRFLQEQEMNDLRYTDAVIKETLRLYPPVPYFGRKLVSEITTGGFTFPADVEIVISPYLMGRNPRYFENPLEFRPDRFLGVDPPLAYTAFSIGAKKCIGGKLAMMALKIGIAKSVINFKVSLPKDFPEITLVSEVILKSKDKIPLNLERRLR